MDTVYHGREGRTARIALSLMKGVQETAVPPTLVDAAHDFQGSFSLISARHASWLRVPQYFNIVSLVGDI